MPEVLIKADDLRPTTLSRRWRAFLEHCAERGYHANVGVMGGWTSKGGDDDGATPDEAREMLRWVQEQPTLHLWNHGFTHLGDRTTNTSEFLNAPLEEQIAAIRKTQDRIEELSGERLDGWGAPFNWTDHNTVLALQEFPEIKYAFYTPYVPGKFVFHHELFVTCEPFEGEVKPGAPRYFSLEQALKKSQHFRDLGRSFVVQVHPNRWTKGSIDSFTEFIETLRSEGYETGTLASFAQQDLFAKPGQKARRLPHRVAPKPAPKPAPEPAPAPAPVPASGRSWTQKVPAPLKRAVPESWRRRLRGDGR